MAITDFIDNLIILHCLLYLKLHRIYFSFAILGSYILGWRSSKYICCENTAFYPKYRADFYLYSEILHVFCYFALLCLRSQAFKWQSWWSAGEERTSLPCLRSVESEPLETLAKPQSQGHDHMITNQNTTQSSSPGPPGFCQVCLGLLSWEAKRLQEDPWFW